MRSAALFVLLVSAALLASAQVVDVVIAGNNTVRGNALELGSSFLKVPFAQPPVGNLRLKAPVPRTEVNQIYDATGYPTQCRQSDGGSEDCLYLAIYVPSGANNNSNLPVRHWIYGGSYTNGDISSYYGQNLAEQTNTIVVASNYRVGILGFLVTSASAAQGDTGNYGLLDQQAAIRWTHENIAAFGGNPNNITIFGESAGGSSVSLQLLMNGTWPYFRRAIIESGGPWDFRTLAEATNISDQALRIQCNTQCLQGLPIENIMAIPAVPFGQPIIDGKLLTAQPLSLFRDGKFKRDAEIIVGINADEGKFLAQSSYALVANLTNPEVFIRLNQAYNVKTNIEQNITSFYGFPSRWPVSPDASRDPEYNAWSTFIGDYFIKCGNQGLAQYASAAGATVYTYYFFYNNDTAEGTYHSFEIPFVFNDTESFGGGPTAAEISQIFVRHFENFQNTGNPNGPTVSQWDAFNRTANTLWIGSPVTFQSSFVNLPQCNNILIPLYVRPSSIDSSTNSTGPSTSSSTSTTNNVSGTTDDVAGSGSTVSYLLVVVVFAIAFAL